MADLLEKSGGKLSTDELTARLFVRLHREGALNRLSSESRRQLIGYLNSQTNDNEASRLIPEAGQSIDYDVNRRDRILSLRHPFTATNWLVADHLLRNNYTSTLSAFGIECGRSDMLDVFSVMDILSFLGYDLSTTKCKHLVSDYLDKTSTLFLWKLLLWVNHDRELPLIFTDKGIQTDDNDLDVSDWKPTSRDIQSKLRELDALYSRKKAIVRPLPNTGSLDALERIVALNAVAGLGEEVKVLRESEAKWANERERENARKGMDDFRKSLEDQYTSRLERLMERERDATHALEKQKDGIEEEFYRQRQRIIADVSSLNRRRDQLETEFTQRRTELNLELSRLEQFKKDIENREEDLLNRETKYDDWLRAQRDRIAKEERQNNEECRRELEIKERDLQRQQTRLLEAEKELHLKRSYHEESVRNSEKQRSALEVAQKEIESLKNQISEFAAQHSEELTSLRVSLKDAERRATNSQRHDDNVKEMLTRMTRTCEVLTLQVTSLREEKNEIVATTSSRQYELESQLATANSKLKEYQDRMDTVRSRMMELDKSACDRRYSLSKMKNPDEGATNLHQTDDSLLETSDVGKVYFHETYFDTSLSVSHLPPELELESGDIKSQIGHHRSFDQSTRDRIRILELEAEALENEYRVFKENNKPTVRFERETQMVSTPNVARNGRFSIPSENNKAEAILQSRHRDFASCKELFVDKNWSRSTTYFKDSPNPSLDNRFIFREADICDRNDGFSSHPTRETYISPESKSLEFDADFSVTNEVRGKRLQKNSRQNSTGSCQPDHVSFTIPIDGHEFTGVGFFDKVREGQSFVGGKTTDTSFQLQDSQEQLLIAVEDSTDPVDQVAKKLQSDFDNYNSNSQFILHPKEEGHLDNERQPITINTDGTSESKPIDPKIKIVSSINKSVSDTKKEKNFVEVQVSTMKEENFVEVQMSTKKQSDPVSDISPVSVAKKCENQLRLVPPLERSDLFASTIDLDSVWKRTEDSSESSNNKTNSDEINTNARALPPLHSTPHSSMMTIENTRTHDDSVIRTKEEELDKGDENIVNLDISGGASNPQSENSDFEW